MPKIIIPSGVVHDVPPDLKKALLADGEALGLWADITPLARNEWRSPEANATEGSRGKMCSSY